MRTQQLVEIRVTGGLAEADGGEEVLVGGQELKRAGRIQVEKRNDKRNPRKRKGPTGIRTQVAGFKVQRDNHYTIRQLLYDRITL